MRDDVPSEFRNAVSMHASARTESEVLFKSGVFNLEEGRHITKSDRGKVLVHRKFAEQNKLKIHDKIKLKLLRAEGNSTVGEAGTSGATTSTDGSVSSGREETFEIVGIFSGKMQEQHTGLPTDLSENAVFTDYETIQKGLGYTGVSRVASSITVTTNSPENLETAEKNIRKLNLDWSKFETTKNNGAFKEASESLSGVKSIVRIMTLAILGGGVVVLSLILVLWLRERIYEIGILLSIGVNKLAIVGQFILELVLVSIPVMLPALIIGKISSSFIISGFIANDESGAVAGILSDGGIGVTLMSFTLSYALLLAIIIVSVVITSGAILIHRPKDILSKIS